MIFDGVLNTWCEIILFKKAKVIKKKKRKWSLEERTPQTGLNLNGSTFSFHSQPSACRPVKWAVQLFSDWFTLSYHRASAALSSALFPQRVSANKRATCNYSHRSNRISIYQNESLQVEEGTSVLSQEPPLIWKGPMSWSRDECVHADGLYGSWAPRVPLCASEIREWIKTNK